MGTTHVPTNRQADAPARSDDRRDAIQRQEGARSGPRPAAGAGAAGHTEHPVPFARKAQGSAHQAPAFPRPSLRAPSCLLSCRGARPQR